MTFGCVADDFTGATDLCSSLRRAGQRSVIVTDLGVAPSLLPPTDVVVVALKSRAAARPAAVADSLAAGRWLRAAGAEQLYFKYCSTFDSTPEGNIGPVLDALLDELEARATIVCPAHPEQRRTIYQGHLFVGEALLADSPMAHHPINPMRDSSLLRLLGPQTRRRIGLLPHAEVDAGAASLRGAFEKLAAEGVFYAVVDAVVERHLATIAEAFHDLPLLSGGAGVGAALGSFYARGRVGAATSAGLPGPGPAVVLAGSSSLATRTQLAHLNGTVPLRTIDAVALHDGSDDSVEVARWAASNLGSKPVVVAASASPERVAETQRLLGAAAASEAIERTLAEVACAVVAAGARRLVVAGGETSAAIVRALGLRWLEVGDDVEPGVPWMRAGDRPSLMLALKSGNFGSPSFLERAVAGAG